MDTIKYIKRKYPYSYEEIIKEFNNDELYNVKIFKRKIGRLKKDIIFARNVEYPKGQLCIWNRYKEINYDTGKWTGNFETYCLVKCRKKHMTASGYHSIYINDTDIEEILK